eukprot:49987_1
MLQHLFVTLTLLLLTPSSAAVLGIDFGTNRIKVAAVVPGKSFEIVLDEASKRSHPSLVVFDDDVRQYGTSASSLVTKRPLRSFLQFSRLLGKPSDTQLIQQLQSNSIFNEIIPDEKRNTVRFVSPYYDPSQVDVSSEDQDSDEEPSIENAANILNIIASEPSISVEEVATMKLKHIKKMAETETESDIKDCVITVPEYWSYKERQALLDASQMAGLNVLGLINENTAAALQYALKRDYQENKTEIVIFYNMGATATKVSIVKYFSIQAGKKKKSKKTNPGKGAFEVLAVSWDETLGAVSFDQVLAQIIIERAFEALSQRKTVKEDFTDKTFQYKLRKDPRFTARVRNAATRAKKILSANTETFVSIEGLYADEDFSTTITRELLYELSEDLFARSTVPLKDAVRISGYNKEDVDSIVLVGGGTRIPKIRSLLTTFLEKPLKEDLNADEAPAFGAAFRAANLSSTFRVRAVGMDDITPFAVGVRLKDLRPSEDDEKPFKKRGSLFNENNHLFRRRAVTLKHAKDLRVELFYEKSAPLPTDTSRDLGYYEISGIPKAITKYHSERYNVTELPKVSLSFLLDANGVVDLVAATASFTEWVTEEKVIKKKKKESDEEVETESDTESSEDASETDSDKEESTSEDSEKEKETESEPEVSDKEVELIPRKRTHRVELNVQRNLPEDVASMSSADFALSAKILLELDERDRSVRETADARNELESYIFESRNRLYEEKNVEKVSTESEREDFIQVLTESEDWIWDVEKESSGIYKAKTRELKKIGNPLFTRADEINARPAAIDAAGKTLGQLYESVEMLRVNYTWVNATEVDRLNNKTKKVEKWLNMKIEDQDEKSLLEAPAFFSYEVYNQLQPVVEYAKKLLSRPKPYNWGKKKKAKNGTNATTDGNKTQKGEGEEEKLTADIKVDASLGEEDVDESDENVEQEEGDDDDEEKK